MARPVGGAAGSLEQFGAGPHKLQVWFTQVMFAVWNDITLLIKKNKSTGHVLLHHNDMITALKLPLGWVK